MTNLHLEPGEGSLEELIAGVERGPLPRDEQELVDRRQAAQLPVRDAGRLGDRRRQARPDVPRRDLHGHHAAVLGLARRSRRSRRVAAARADELRQGTAGPGRRTSRTAPRPPASAACRSGFGRERARRRRASRSSTRPPRPTRRTCSSSGAFGPRALRRRPTQHQPTLLDDTVVTLRAVRDGRVGVAVTNRTSDDGLRELAARAADAADRIARGSRLPGAGRARRSACGRRLRRGDGRTRRRRAGAASRPRRSRRPATRRRTASSRAASRSSRSSPTTGIEVTQRLTDATVLVLAAAEGQSGYATQSVVGGLRRRSDVHARPRPPRRATRTNGRARDRAAGVPRRARAVRARRAPAVLRLGLVRRPRPARGAELPDRARSASACSTRR